MSEKGKGLTQETIERFRSHAQNVNVETGALFFLEKMATRKPTGLMDGLVDEARGKLRPAIDELAKALQTMKEEIRMRRYREIIVLGTAAKVDAWLEQFKDPVNRELPPWINEYVVRPTDYGPYEGVVDCEEGELADETWMGMYQDAIRTAKDMGIYDEPKDDNPAAAPSATEPRAEPEVEQPTVETAPPVSADQAPVVSGSHLSEPEPAEDLVDVQIVGDGFPPEIQHVVVFTPEVEAILNRPEQEKTPAAEPEKPRASTKARDRIAIDRPGFGERLQAWRKSKGWSQYYVAHKMGTQPGNMFHLEHGRLKSLSIAWYDALRSLGFNEFTPAPPVEQPTMTAMDASAEDPQVKASKLKRSNREKGGTSIYIDGQAVSSRTLLADMISTAAAREGLADPWVEVSKGMGLLLKCKIEEKKVLLEWLDERGEVEVRQRGQVVLDEDRTKIKWSNTHESINTSAVV